MRHGMALLIRIIARRRADSKWLEQILVMRCAFGLHAISAYTWYRNLPGEGAQCHTRAYSPSAPATRPAGGSCQHAGGPI